MKKYYKTKTINITKLKTYLKDGTKTTSKRSRRCTCGKHNGTKCCNVQ